MDGKDELVDIVEKIAEEKIRAAMERGEFDNLPGAGRPLALEDLSAVPEHLRAGYKLLKNAGFVPPEVELKKEIARLEEALARAHSQKEKQALLRQLQEKTITCNVMLERNRKR